MLIPVVVIVGRPNVGKSTIFNALSNTRDALVYDQPGVTRDRIFGEGRVGPCRYWIVDTGGIQSDGYAKHSVESMVVDQAWQAVEESDVVLWILDARAGVTPEDLEIGQALRRLNKPIVPVANKTDGMDALSALADFYELGFGEPVAISAAHRRGLLALMEGVFSTHAGVLQAKQDIATAQAAQDAALLAEHHRIRVAIVGRPNVGKSTLINRLLGEARVVVYDEPGTTRDSIYIPFTRGDTQYTLIDTAGVRRRGRIDAVVEKFSVVKTLQAIEDAHVVVLLLDAQEGVTEQDLHLVGHVLDQGRGILIVANKWDGLDTEQKKSFETQLQWRLEFAAFLPHYYISAQRGSGVGNLWEAMSKCYASATMTVGSRVLTDCLADAVKQNHPPRAAGGRSIKLRYAHLGGHHPFKIVIHGNQTHLLPMHYQRYLSKFFVERLKLFATPVQLILKTGENPYADRPNVLSARQLRRRERMIAHRKR
jgi:GTP-binding protein